MSAFRAGSVGEGLLLFLAYAVGMGLVVGTAAVALATARTTVIARLRRLAPVVSRAAGAVVLLSGAYVAYYGWYEWRLWQGGEANDPIIEGAASVQGWLARTTEQLGIVGISAAFVMVLAAAVALARGR